MDEIDRINSMNENDLENFINQTIQERWKNNLRAVSQNNLHHHELSSVEQQLSEGDESSDTSFTSNISSDDDEASDSTHLISKNAAIALSRSFSQTMY